MARVASTPPGSNNRGLGREATPEGTLSYDPLINRSSRLDSKRGWEYIFAVETPQSASKAQRKRDAWDSFLRRHHSGRKAQDVLLEKIYPAARSAASVSAHDGNSESLEGALNCTIGMLESLFRTLSESLQADIDLLQFASIEKNKVFICTRMSLKLSETLADLDEYPVQLSKAGVNKLGIRISDQAGIVPAFVKYDKSQKASGLLESVDHPAEPGSSHVLRHIDRIRLMYDKITDYIEVWELTKLFSQCQVTFKMFAAHDPVEVEELRKTWASFRHFFNLWQPIDEVRNYFGEGIAMYFLFTNTMRFGLLVLLAIALPVDMCERFLGFGDAPKVLYGFVIIVWFTWLLKYWRRTESYYANRWGTDFVYEGTSVKEVVNPDFHDPPQPSEKDENVNELQPDPQKRLLGLILSYCVTVVFMLVALICVICGRVYASKHGLDVSVAARLLALQIKVFDFIWQNIGVVLTAFEQHPYLRTFEQSYGMKYFIFLFFNTFNGFIWIAFVQPSVDPEGCAAVGGCDHMLRLTLVQSFPVIVIFAFMGLAIPWGQIRYNYWRQKRAIKQNCPEEEEYQISCFEEESKMLEYTGNDQTNDFLQVILSMAFVSLFGVMAPLVTVGLAFVAVSVQMRVDAMRVCVLYQRPYPSRVADIGVWNPAMKFLNYACVLVTAGILVSHYMEHIDRQLFKMVDVFGKSSDTLNRTDRLLIYLLFCIACTLFVVAVDLGIPNQTARTRLEKLRQQHQRSQLFDFANDEVSENVRVEGHGNWGRSQFHEVSQLRPGDSMWVQPIAF